MIGSQIYRRFLFLGLSTAIVVVILGLVSTFLVSRIKSDEKDFPRPDLFMARVLYALDRKDPIKALEEFEKSVGDTNFPRRVVILDETGKPIAGAVDAPLPNFSQESLPSSDFEIKRPEKPSFLYPPQMGGIVRLPYRPPRYLVMIPDHEGPRPRGPGGGLPPFGVFPPVFIALFVSMLLGIAIAIALILFSIRKRAEQADSVIAKLRSGDLKARFKIIRNDEFGRAMQRFNQMADEIEHLVERLRHAERGRITLLQDLTHDLRTPIASLLTALETLEAKEDRLKPEERANLFALAVREVEYFDRLVDDLLFLALLSEPNYKADKEKFSLLELIENEIEVSLSARDAVDKNLSIHFRHNFEAIELTADPHLFQRVMRNALNNACSFAKKQVFVHVSTDAKFLFITFEDDGPGFPEEKLAGFGQRKFSRMVNQESHARISVGLGSVIMKVVCELHGGSIHAKNIKDGGAVRGATVQITLPISMVDQLKTTEVTTELQSP